MYSLGCMIVASVFGRSGPVAGDDKKTRRLSLLTPQERELYGQIVQQLVNNCSAHADRTKASKNSPTYWIIFREVESWEKVDRMIQKVHNGDYTVSVWAEEWHKRISDLRGLEKRVSLAIDAGKDASGKDREAKVQAIADLRLRIKNALKEARDELVKQVRDKQLTDNPQIHKVLRFLAERWRHLTVFREWTEVPMDCSEEAKLFVQVREPQQSTKDKQESFLNPSTKAIFTIEELDTPLRELGMVQHNIGPNSPSVHRRSSSVVLRSEGFFEHHYASKGGKFQKSSLGDRLHFIVNLALDQVNGTLATAQGRANSAPPSSTSRGPRFDFSIFSGFLGSSKGEDDN